MEVAEDARLEGRVRAEAPTRTPDRRNGYLFGSYRIATAPEANSSRPTSFRSRGFNSPANSEFVFVDQSQLRQCERELQASHEQSVARLPLEPLHGLPQIPAHELRVPVDPVQGARHDVLPCRVDGPGERLHPIGHPIRPHSRPGRRPPRFLHHFISHPAKEKGIGLGEVVGVVTMHLFVGDDCAVVAAAVQCDVDGIPKGSHYVIPPRESGPPNGELPRRGAAPTSEA
jgi:hypothetical protein